MKKVISIFLSLALIISTLSIGFTAYAEVLEEKAVESFVDNACEVIQEHDADKELLPSEDEDDEPDFQTCRLIVKADGGFDDFGAVEHIKGFMDFHILQYKNETDTENAYNSLSKQKNIVSVNIDKIVSPIQAEEDESDTSTDVFPQSTNGHLCDWATERTQSAQVNEYIKKNNIPLTDITVGVIDQGIDYNHEFLQGRIVRTYFNSSTDGNENDELDLIDGHGTAVSSVVVDNTPESVSVAVYRVLDDTGDNSILGVATGILQAVNNNVDIINISLGYIDENDLTKSACELADEKDIPVVASSGNEGKNVLLQNSSPAIIESVITVGALSKENRICSWSNSGIAVDFVAPGETINVAVSNNRYDVWDGTSFASPCVAGIIALIKSVNYDYSYDKIESLLKQSTLFPLDVYMNNEIYTDEYLNKTTVNNYKIPQYPYSIDCPYKENGYGLVQLDKIFNLTKPTAPKCNYQSGNYTDEIQVELNSDYPIYYTLDGSYPTSSSTLYTEPFVIKEDTDLRAVSYDKNSIIKYSNELECEYQMFQKGTDDMFEINESGCITNYTGNVKNLLVPDEIKGITVKTFTSQIFNDGIITKIILPNTLEEIPEKAFYENQNLYYINTGGAKNIQQNAFNQCRYSIQTIDMPNVAEISENAFKSCFGLYSRGFKINAPQLKTVQRLSFYNCNLTIVAPQLETLYYRAFENCTIMDVVFPNLKSVLGERPLPNNAPFSKCNIFALDLPILQESECNFISTDGNSFQYVNMPQFNGKLTQNSEYEYLNYYSITKETADLSGITYYNADALGGSIRVTDAGLRFGFSYDETQTDNVDEYGFVYALGDVDPYTLYVEDVDNSSVYKLVANNRITHEDNTTTFNLVFTDIPNTSYDKQVSVRAYVKIDGNYYYSDKLCYSFNDIAQKVLSDNEIDQNTKNSLKNLLEV